MPNLQQQLINAIKTFNDARNHGDYGGIKTYLAPYVVMTRIDDHAIVKGTPDEIISYFNRTQAETKFWPTLSNIEADIRVDENKQVVSGKGTYRDKGDDSATAIDCVYRYHFTEDGKIDVATLIPLVGGGG